MIEFPREYLGDAVYASFDGYQVLLHLNRHDSEPVIALEPDVLHALFEYHNRIVLIGQQKEKDET